MLSELKIRIIKTVVLYASYFSMGLVTSIPGPTLVDLQLKANTTPQTMSYLLSGQAVFLITGALGGSIFMDRFRRQTLYGCALLLVAIGTLGLPWWKHFIPMAPFIAIIGLGVGTNLGAASVWCLDLWGDSSQPFLQALFFFYGIGNFIVPLVAAPFLAPIQNSTSKVINNSTYLTVNLTSGYDDNSPTYVYPTDGFYVVTPYLVVGSLTLAIAIVILVIAFIFPQEAKRDTVVAKEEISLSEKPERPRKLEGRQKMYLIIMVICFLFGYSGMETIFELQITTYVVYCSLDVGKQTGSYMTSLFRGCFVTGRGLAVLASIKLSPRAILAFNCTVYTLSAAFLVCWGNSNLIVLWIGVATTGIGMSSCWPSMFNWFETFVPISNRISYSINIGAALGAIIYPLIVGKFIEETPLILFYSILGGSIFMSVFYIIMLAFTFKVTSDLELVDEYKLR